MCDTPADGRLKAATIIDTAAALATIGTLIWAVWNGLDLLAQAQEDRRKANKEREQHDWQRRREQPRKVAAWLVGNKPNAVQHQQQLT